MLDLAEHYNKAIAKSAGNPLTSSLPTSLLPASLPPTSLPPTSLPPTSLLPAFKPLISLPPTTSKIFNRYRASTSLKRQVNRITA